MADTQLYHLGYMLKAALVADDATSCAAVYPYRFPFGAAKGKHPCLELYRESEQIGALGNSHVRVRQVKVTCNYYAGPSAIDRLEGWAGTLVERVQIIDDAIEAGRVSSYSGGSNLYTLAGIERVGVDSVEYEWAESGGPIDSAHPAAQLTITMVHRYLRATEGDEPLARIGADIIGAGDTYCVTHAEITADTSEHDGEDGAITAVGTVFAAASAAFTTAHVGWYIRVADATNAGNNGSHLITARTNATTVVLGSATTLVNEAGVNWVLKETA